MADGFVPGLRLAGGFYAGAVRPVLDEALLSDRDMPVTGVRGAKIQSWGIKGLAG